MRTSESSASCVRSDTSPAGEVDAPLVREAQDAGDARVSVLDVVDGVLVRLLLRKLDVELHLALRRSLEEEEPAGVRAHLFDELAERHDLTRPLGEADCLASALQRDELVDEQHERLATDAEDIGELLHERHLSLVVGSPDVDYPVEARTKNLS